MIAATLIRQARKHRGLTQAKLAERLGTTQSAIARLEAGQVDPRMETVLRAVRACELDLHFSLGAIDLDHRRLIDDALSLSPSQRLDDLVERLDAEQDLQRARRVS